MLEDNKKNLSLLAKEFYIGKNENTDEQIKLLNQLESFPRDEVIELLNLLISEETNPKILAHAVKLIGKYNDSSSINGLIDLLLLKAPHQEDFKNIEDFVKIRCQVAVVLSNLKDSQAVMPLLYVLNDHSENYKLRLSTAEALGKIGDKYAVMPLIEIVSNEEEKSVYLRESAARALGMLNDIRAIDPFIRILETKKGIMDKFTFLKERVIEALAQIGLNDDKTLKALSNSLLDESPYVRLTAIEALSEIDDKRVLEMIEPMIKDEEEDVARSAINALYNIAGKDYIVNLLEIPNLQGWCKDEIETILSEENEDGE